MISPNKGASEEVLQRLKEESYERLRANVFEAVRQKLDDFGMTWDDLANALCWDAGKCDGACLTGKEVKMEVATGILSSQELNDIAHAFSAEVYIIFRPRFPYVNS